MEELNEKLDKENEERNACINQLSDMVTDMHVSSSPVYNYIEPEEPEKIKENLKETIQDFSLPFEDIIDAFNKYISIVDYSEVNDFVNKLALMYLFSNTEMHQKLFKKIIFKTNLNIILKIELALTLCNNIIENNLEDDLGENNLKKDLEDNIEDNIENEDGIEELEEDVIELNNVGLNNMDCDVINEETRKKTYMNYKKKIAYKSLLYVCDIISNSDMVPTPYRISVYTFMANNCSELYDKSIQYFITFVNDQNIYCQYRYETIISLEKSIDIEYTIKLLDVFINNTDNMTLYRILGCQYLLRKNINKENSENLLLKFCFDDMLDEQLRADAADVLLHLGSDNSKERARNIISTLGVNINIYENRQNIHDETISTSAMVILKHLSTIENIEGVTYSDVYKNIGNIVHSYDYNTRCKIFTALDRIRLDNALYNNLSMQSVLVKLWIYITNHKHEEELLKRLIEELIDMSGWCSTGHIYRLLNCLSGFGDFSINISFKDQLFSNLSACINNEIQKFPLEHQYLLLDELALPAHEYDKRKNFRAFFRAFFPLIKEKLYHEFKDYINDTDFDLYMKRAVILYEGENYV